MGPCNPASANLAINKRKIPQPVDHNVGTGPNTNLLLDQDCNEMFLLRQPTQFKA